MEIWAIIGFGMALMVGGMVVLFIGNKAMEALGWSPTVVGLSLLVLTAAYASWGTWMITTKSIPFVQ